MVTASSMQKKWSLSDVQQTFILSMPCCPVIFSLVSVSHVEESMFWMDISSFLFGLKPDIPPLFRVFELSKMCLLALLPLVASTFVYPEYTHARFLRILFVRVKIWDTTKLFRRKPRKTRTHLLQRVRVPLASAGK